MGYTHSVLYTTDEIKNKVSAFFVENMTYNGDSSMGSSSYGTVAANYIINSGTMMGELLKLTLPQTGENMVSNKNYYLRLDLKEVATSTSAYTCLFKNVNMQSDTLKSHGLDLYMVSNGTTKYMAFGNHKCSFLFDKWYLIGDESVSKDVFIAPLPRVATESTVFDDNTYATNLSETDHPKVCILNRSTTYLYSCDNIITRPDSEPFTPGESFYSTDDAHTADSLVTGIVSDYVQNNFGFSSSYYVRPYTHKGYMSKTLYIVDGGNSLLPYGIVNIGDFSYIRITGNIFMRVGED